MTSTSSDIEIKQFSTRLLNGGQINVPPPVQDSLNLTEGDALTLLVIGDLVLLTPKLPQVSQLTEEIVSLMEAEGVTLEDLLSGLEEERIAMWKNHSRDA